MPLLSGRAVADIACFCLGVVSALIGVWQMRHVGPNIQSSDSLDSPPLTFKMGEVEFRMADGRFHLEFEVDNQIKLLGTVGKTMGGFMKTCLTTKESDTGNNLCMEWLDTASFTASQRSTRNIECYDVLWQATRCQSQILKDCYLMADAHWYGGAEEWYQYWPLELWSKDELPYVASDAYNGQIGGVMERYFFNTNGFAIFVDKDVPLYVSINKTGDQELCLISKYASPYNNYDNSLPHLKYTVCRASNVKTIHEYMSSTYFRRATEIPDRRLFRSPIWSTWAQFKKDVDETKVMTFANDIISHNFSHSQIEIDDDWTVHYGDMDFNRTKFPDPLRMVNTLTGLGFRTTIWVHPFATIHSEAFQFGANRKYFITEPRGDIPVLVSWWRSNASAVLDVSNPSAVQWYLQRLRKLQSDYGISSFKFDAGEVYWLPVAYKLHRAFISPDEYTTKWAELAYESDKDIRHQEVRVGCRTQHLPIFVRMMDKESHWGYENGLKTIIPLSLTYGLLGYPFVLPDMIGGNAYDGDIDDLAYPDKELYIRWLQLNVFLPSMQFSIVPWNYDDVVVSISRRYVQLHEEYSDKIIELAEEYTRTGAPIIRPLWWIAPNDEDAQTIDSEFLLGNDILVSPIVEYGARQRDIYLPVGQWFDHIHKYIRQGEQWYRGYKVELDQLAYFTKQ